MSRAKTKRLKGLLRERIKIADRAVEESKTLKKRVNELEESCAAFSEVEQNLHKKIDELTKVSSKSIKKRFVSFFS